jgi:hypothetical protein
MKGYTQIITKGMDTYAIIIKGSPLEEGARFLTQPEDEFQLGLFSRPAGYKVAPHAHPPRNRKIHSTCEVICVQEGKMAVSIYDEDWKHITREILEPGHFVLFLRGGHAVEILEPTWFLEVKQGPYLGDKEAKIYQSPTDAPSPDIQG